MVLKERKQASNLFCLFNSCFLEYLIPCLYHGFIIFNSTSHSTNTYVFMLLCKSQRQREREREREREMVSLKIG
jgi:hypothetical protein